MATNQISGQQSHWSDSGSPCEQTAHSSWMAPRRTLVLGAATVAALTTGFSALYWNRFLAASAGGTFFYLAEEILRGRIPYRDVFLVVTPLQAFKLAGLIRVFGDTIAVARAEAALERTVLAVLLYLLLARFCRTGSAIAASFLTITVLATDQADAIINYHIDSVFWAVAAVWFVGFWIRSNPPGARTWAPVLAGACASLSVLTKQTTGMGVTVALAMAGALIAARSSSVREAVRFLVGLLSGWTVPIVIFFFWLYRTQALAPFLGTVVAANTSKGSLLTVLVRPVSQFWVLLVIAAEASIFGAVVLRFQRRRTAPDSLGKIAAVTAACVATIGVAVAAIYTAKAGASPLLPAPKLRQMAELLTIAGGFTGSIVIFGVYAWRWRSRPLTKSEAQIWLLSAVSAAAAYMLALSWGIYSPMAAPGVALVAGLAIDRVHGAKQFAMLTVACLVIYASVTEKLSMPFNWLGWAEPATAEARYASALPKLAGLRMSKPTLELCEKITGLIRQYTKSGDSLLVYPYFPMFYVLTEREQPTYSFNHYIDVCPDQVCSEDAKRISRRPPDAIIYMRQTADDWQDFERTFRSGKMSGSHEVADAIERLAPEYDNVFAERIPGSGRRIEVLIRKEALRKEDRASRSSEMLP